MTENPGAVELVLMEADVTCLKGTVLGPPNAILAEPVPSVTGPLTSRAAVGVVVPIPRFPAELTTTRFEPE